MNIMSCSVIKPVVADPSSRFPSSHNHGWRRRIKGPMENVVRNHHRVRPQRPRSCRNKVQVYRSIRMLICIHHFACLTPLVMINDSILEPSLEFSKTLSLPSRRAKAIAVLKCATGSSEVEIGSESSWGPTTPGGEEPTSVPNLPVDVKLLGKINLLIPRSEHSTDGLAQEGGLLRLPPKH
ncbi:hypothetical protein HAX54_010143 [Datura stramonium]|uniref:Uncharacterized protein n=1 Tax=Datura stramonium TaxID=4076 RepID=A0ABS8TIL8_DATST|nr:hypothetical protein [Datura stramonium]